MAPYLSLKRYIVICLLIILRLVGLEVACFGVGVLRKQGLPVLSALAATLLGHPVLSPFDTNASKEGGRGDL